MFAERATASSDGVADEDEGVEWQTTPLNYLEKIFQVPFAIRPMGETGFSAMIDDLVRADGDGGDTNGKGVGAAGSSVGGEETNGRTLAETGDGTDGGASEVDGQAPVDATSPQSGVQGGEDSGEDEDTTPVDPSPGFLRISDEERLFMAHLHPLVVTPRAAKRFVNVYRILKASIAPKRRAMLDDEASQQVVLLMLAMLTSHPAETTPILQALVAPNPPADWWTLVDTVREAERRLTREAERRLTREAAGKDEPGPDAVEEDDGWKALDEKLAKVRPYVQTAGSAMFAEWARDVSRFSFESSRVLLAPQSTPPSRADAPVSAAP